MVYWIYPSRDDYETEEEYMEACECYDRAEADSIDEYIEQERSSRCCACG